MHWTRMGIAISAGAGLIATFLPWLTEVPPKVLTIGSGTIYGITTIHGIICAVLAVGAIAFAMFLPDRRCRLHRGGLAGLIVMAIIAVSIGSLVLGTNQSELLEEAEKQTLERTKDQHLANLAVIVMAKILDKHPVETGVGGYPLVFGWALVALIAIIGMFLRREPHLGASPQQPRRSGAHPPPGMT